MNIISAHSPARTADGGVDLVVVFDAFPNTELSFHARPDDVEPHGRELYDRALAREFGDVAPYVAPVTSLSDAKAAKQESITVGAESFLQSLALEYGAMEKLTWDQQAVEADALIADPNTSAPLVRSIAASRGMDCFVLAGRIRNNRAQWVLLSGYIVGLRLKFQDQLDVATTIEQVAAIEPVYALP